MLGQVGFDVSPVFPHDAWPNSRNRTRQINAEWWNGKASCDGWAWQKLLQDREEPMCSTRPRHPMVFRISYWRHVCHCHLYLLDQLSI